MGSAEVTHPFHPRRGQRFVVLKVRQVSGVVRGGDGFYDYQDALIALDISNGTVTGQLRPLLGHRTAPVNVRGTNPQDGVLDLIIDLPAGPKTYKFTK